MNSASCPLSWVTCSSLFCCCPVVFGTVHPAAPARCSGVVASAAASPADPTAQPAIARTPPRSLALSHLVPSPPSHRPNADQPSSEVWCLAANPRSTSSASTVVTHRYVHGSVDVVKRFARQMRSGCRAVHVRHPHQQLAEL